MNQVSAPWGRFAETLQRDVFQRCLKLCVVGAVQVGHGCQDEAGGHGVDADAGGSLFRGQVAGEGFNEGFAGSVCGPQRDDLGRGHG
jgi:hypothetical protein